MVMTFQNSDPPPDGTYLSCFPLDKHFDQLSRKDPPISDIKWGRFGPNQEPLFVYTRRQWTTRSLKWFEYVDPNDILGRTVNWIIEKSKAAIPGDVVNMIFLCHGTRRGHLVLGTKKLETVEFVNLCRVFAPG